MIVTFVDLLAEPVVIVAPLAFQKQNLHALRHVDSKEHVWVAHNGRRAREDHGLEDWVFGQIFLSEALDAEMPFNHKGTVQAAEDAECDEEDDFEEVPRSIVPHLEHDQLAGSKGVHCLR
jgi:hypothetical protein